MAGGKVKGLFLDLDGTLALSGDLVRRTYLDFMEGHGRQGCQAEYESLLARPIHQWVAVLKEKHKLIPAETALYQEFEGLLEQRYPGQATLAPGAKELLTYAQVRGVFTVLVTSAARALVEGFLRRHALIDLMGAVVTAEDVVRGKPDPEPYLKALDLAGLNPAQALAVEDSSNGARSAMTAGLKTYLVVHEDEGPPPILPGLAGVICRLGELMPLMGDLEDALTGLPHPRS